MAGNHTGQKHNLAPERREGKAYTGLIGRLISHLGINLGYCRRVLGLQDHAVERMMNHCSACGDANTCARLLDAPKGKVTAPPDFCPNARLLSSLREQMDAAEGKDTSR